MRTKSPASGGRMLPRERDPPTPSPNSTFTRFPLPCSSTRQGEMRELSGKEIHGRMEGKDWLKKDTCIRCEETGIILICNVSSCPIAIHENCLPCKPAFDDEGKFYCPYCSYKRALIQAHKLRKKAMAAKKALSSFIGSGVPTGNNSEKKDEISEKVRTMSGMLSDDEDNFESVGNSSETNIDGILDEGDLPLNINLQSQANYAGGKNPIKRKKRVKMNAQKIKKQQIVNKEIQDDSQPHPCASGGSDSIENSSEGDVDGGQDEIELPVNTNLGSRDNYAGGETPFKGKMGVKAKAHKIKKQRNNEFSRRSTRAQNKENEKDSSNKIEVSKSKVLKQSPKSVKELKRSSFPNAKRRRLQWTTEEEEMLREGVRKHSTSVNKNLPWRKILESGRFEGTRSPADLKDKWRKMQAR